MRRFLTVLCAATMILAPSGAAQAAPPQVFNVRDFGAVGDGVANDSPAADLAIAAANAAGGGVVRFPPGTYLAGGSIHMRSHVTVQLDAGATLLGAATGYDLAEPNPWDRYQDFGHSHFHNAMIWGEGLTDIGFVGEGVIDGGGRFITGNPRPGQADKLISLTRCHNLTVSGITLRRGGHFAMLINGCHRVFSEGLTIDTASDRDGWNIISTTDVLIRNIRIAADDDALAFKSDYALGEKLPNGNVTVEGAQLSAVCCNALMFGSETCGDFTNYRFNNIIITGAGKSGLGMVSMDGTNISNVHYSNISMRGTRSPIMEKVGTRRRCGDNPGVGSISDIHYTNITGTEAGSFSPTLWGHPEHPIRDVTFTNVRLTLPGGRPAMDPNAVPSDNGDYNPSSLGIRPAYGFYLHHVERVSFDNSSFGLQADDGRPAFIANAGRDISLRSVSLQRSNGPFDAGFQAVQGYCVAATRARLSTPGSVPACNAGADNFALTATPPAAEITAGTSAAFTIGSEVVAGKPGAITLSASGAPNGVGVSFDRTVLAPGESATMTVAVDPATRNGTYTLSVVGSGETATQYAFIRITVVGGTDLIVTNLVVADTANAADWSIQEGLAVGSVQYGDRTFTLTAVPPPLLGAVWIRSANDSKMATFNPLVSFTLNTAGTVSLAVDTRLGRRPWMDSSWASTGTQLTNSESGARTFEIFAKTFPAGPVSLGPQADPANASSMYTIIVT